MVKNIQSLNSDTLPNTEHAKYQNPLRNTLNAMDIHALLNHDSPSTQRFNRLQKDRSLRQPTLTNTADFPPPRTRAPELTRDQKIEMRTLRTHNKWTYSTIAKATGHTIGQVRLALTGPLTP